MGSIYEKNGAFHWRCYSNVDIKTGVPLPANSDGKILRTLQSVVLVRKDDALHRSKGSPAVLTLATQRAEEIASWEQRATMAAEEGKRSPNGNMLVSDFYERVFLPMMERRANAGGDTKVKHATITTYRRYWSGYLKAHYNGSKTLRSYEPYMGSQFNTYGGGVCF